MKKLLLTASILLIGTFSAQDSFANTKLIFNMDTGANVALNNDSRIIGMRTPESQKQPISEVGIDYHETTQPAENQVILKQIPSETPVYVIQDIEHTSRHRAVQDALLADEANSVSRTESRLKVMNEYDAVQ